MFSTKAALCQYVFNGSPREAGKRATKRVQRIIQDSTPKKTEVLRDGGFVHGRVAPVPR